MDNQDQLEKLSTEIVEEKERHKRYKEKEKQRHTKRVRDIKQESGLKELITMCNRVKTIGKDRRKLRHELEDLVYPVIGEMSTRKRQTYSKITIREGNVYKYNKGKKPNLGAFLDESDKVRRTVIPDDKKEQFDDIVEVLEDLDLYTDGRAKESSRRTQVNEYSTEKEIEKQHTDRDHNIMMCYQSDSPNHMKILGKPKYEERKGAWGGIWSTRTAKTNVETNNKDQLSKLIKYMPYFKPMVEDILERLEESRERRRDAKDQITELTSNYHFVNAL